MRRVSANVVTQLACEVGDGRKDASGDDFSFDPCKPEFDLVQPGRVSGREVQMYVGVLGKEILHQLRLWVERLSRIMWISSLEGRPQTTSPKKVTKSWLVWRAVVFP